MATLKNQAFNDKLSVAAQSYVSANPGILNFNVAAQPVPVPEPEVDWDAVDAAAAAARQMAAQEQKPVTTNKWILIGIVVAAAVAVWFVVKE